MATLRRRAWPDTSSPSRHKGKAVPAPRGTAAAPFSSASLLLPTALVLVRLSSGMLNTIADCDETFNFWEPMHYLLHGFGFQTWEYSPRFALRSYAYVALHAAVGRVAELLAGGDKLAAFYGVRLALGLACALCELAFCHAVARAHGRELGLLTAALLLTSSGVYHASTAFLPSSFSMYGVMLVYWAWLRGRHRAAVLLGVGTVIVGNWPFVGAIFMPLALDTLRARGLPRALAWGVQAGLLFLLPCACVDAWYYRRWPPVVPAWNLVAYNALGQGGGGGGAELYGTEPASFYFKNAALNLSLVFPLALLAAPLLAALAVAAWLWPAAPAPGTCAKGRCGAQGVVDAPLSAAALSLHLSPLYLWFGIMLSRPHKEERFLFPVYPLFCLAAAVCLAMTRRRLAACGARAAALARTGVATVLLACAVLGAARTASTLRGYGAPLRIYHEVAALGPTLRGPARLCVGQEWYRFPASFFVASAPRLNVSFVRGGFGGHLPAHFREAGAGAAAGGAALPLPGTALEGGLFN
eukprot:g2225.t1